MNETEEKYESLPESRKYEIFEQEFEPHMESLYNFAYNLVYNEQDAQDLVQEAFMRAYRSIEKYHEGTNAKAWLFTILKNAFINNYRKASKRPNKVELEEVTGHNNEEDTPYSSQVDMREEIFQKMMGDEVSIAINSLDDNSRAVILLRDVEGFTYEEIASIMDIPTGTVRSRLHRSRNRLKELLQSYAESKGYEDHRK